jgi:crossover junction endodeoxyribonuclease RuvC
MSKKFGLMLICKEIFMKIIGIDPGIAITGWAVLEFDGREVVEILDYGVIETSKELNTGERLSEIYSDLCKILETFEPEVAGVETLIFCNNAKTAMQVGEARGVVVLALEQAGIEICEFTPLQVKSSISGYGKANKEQVQENVKRMCKLDRIPKPDDAADAIAVAICCNDALVLNNLSKLNRMA